MAKQLTIEEYALGRQRHITKRDVFLDRMDDILPWDELNALVAPYYYTKRKGRKPVDLETMLRMYLLRDWFRLSDSAVEDAVYDSYAMRRFMKLDFTRETVPDASTLGKFRKLIGRYKLTAKIAETVAQSVSAKGYKIKKTKVTDVAVYKVRVKK